MQIKWRYVSYGLLASGLGLSAILSGGKGINALQADFDNQKALSDLRSELARTGCFPAKRLSPKVKDTNGRFRYEKANIGLGDKATIEGQEDTPVDQGILVCDGAGRIGMVNASGFVAVPSQFAGTKVRTLPNVKTRPLKVKPEDTEQTPFDYASVWQQSVGDNGFRIVLTAPKNIDEEGNITTPKRQNGYAPPPLTLD